MDGIRTYNELMKIAYDEIMEQFDLDIDEINHKLERLMIEQYKITIAKDLNLEYMKIFLSEKKFDDYETYCNWYIGEKEKLERERRVIYLENKNLTEYRYRYVKE